MATGEPAPRPVRDRQVLLAAAVVVVGVGAVALLAALVPPLGDALGWSPLVAIVLVVVTLALLVGSIRASLSRARDR